MSTAAWFYLIAEHFLRRPARLTAALLYLSVTLFAFRFPNYSILSIFFLHLGFLFFLRFSRDDKLSWLTLSSLALSCAFLAKQNYGALCSQPSWRRYLPRTGFAIPPERLGSWR